MADYIVIDGGTTNTRISLVKNKKIIETVKCNVGARKGIEDRKLLKNAVKKAVEKLSDKGNPEKILASGMITSEFGLYKLDHITAPAGIKELHDGMHEVHLPEISDIPFVFIPGVKICGETLEETDMMRGEETELIGMAGEDKNAVFVLPGSHSKIIMTDENGRIVKFSTMLTGEMIAAVAEGTILKDAVDLGAEQTENGYLVKGYDYCEKNGLNEALFKVRILKNLLKASAEEVYSFFMGAVLHDEIKQIVKSAGDKVILGGKRQIREAMKIILEEVCDKNIVLLDEDTVSSANSLGMIKIYEFQK